MIKKFTKHFLLWLFALPAVNHALAQAPAITYSSPQSYQLNTPITLLKPTNNGGAVPVGEYGAVTTFAGSGQYGYTEGSATTASFKIPAGMAIDKEDNIYVSDFTNHAIRKITPQGEVSSFAGNGGGGRDNGTGSQASFYNPSGLAFGATGILYVTEQIGHDVRQITPSREVSLLAGSGFPGKTDGYYEKSSFNTPVDVAIGPDGNLYVSEVQNRVIRKITPQGEVTTFAGNGIAAVSNGPLLQASFGSPQGLGFDSKGNLFVCDDYSGVIRKISTDGMVSTFAGNGQNSSVDGTGTSASFSNPDNIAFDTNDDMYVSDGNLIRKITPQGVVTTIAGSTQQGYVNAIGTAARFYGTSGLRFDSQGNLFVGDLSNHVIRKITLSGYTIDKPLPAGLVFNSQDGTISGTPTAASPAQFYNITARNKSGSSTAKLSIEVRGNTPPATQAPQFDYPTPKIYAINKPITPLIPTSRGGGAVEPNGYSVNITLPPGLTLDANTGVISGTPTALSPATIYKITGKNAAGSSTALINIKVSDEELGIASPPRINYTTPQTLYVRTAVTPIIPQQTGGPVHRYSNGLVGAFAGTGQSGRNDGPRASAQFENPAKITIDKDGNYYVTDFSNYSLRKITPAGIVSTLAGAAGPGYVNGAFGTSQLQSPRGVVTDKAGNIYVADGFSIRKITPAGVTSTLAGSGVAGNADGAPNSARFNGVVSLAIDEADNIYAVDNGNGLIRKITPAGQVTTLTGNVTRANIDGQGRNASFTNPQEIIYSNGSFYIADQVAIRKLSPDGMVTTIAGNGRPGVLNGPALQGGFGNASSIAINSLGDMYILDTGNNAPNEGSAILRLIDKDNNLSTLSLMNASGTQAYLSLPNGISFDKDGLMYVPGGENVINTLSFDRYTIDKALPPGLVFDKGTGEITGTPTAIFPETTYTVTAYNSGGYASTQITLKVLPNEAKVSSVITFPEFAANPVWDANFNIDPKVTSNQNETPIVLTSSNTAVVTINPDNTLHILSAGQAIITANQTGNDYYLPATEVSHTITISKTDPIVSFAPIGTKSACDADFSVAGTSTNTATPITYTSTNTDVATVNASGMVHIISAGQTEIKAYQQASALYNEVPESSRALIVTATNAQAPPTVTIEASATKIYEGAPVSFTATTNEAVNSYAWEVNSVPAGTNVATFTSNTLQDQDVVTCTVTFSNRCILPVTSTAPPVTVLPRPLAIVPPNTFSPNADGVNDTWAIPALLSYPNCNVRIFNRNGTQLIRSQGYSKAWDGTYQGKNLPAGVYYYIISPGDGQAAVSGNVTILR
ncbi:T9SS type B sorting domain-containing protein [Mucilaginibacter pedocola]|uniref:BIG2 domain-containing protein n=1 Tax=Mucilaginibacter pedocola TaxID=1792845 RepID=A0A1S9PG47_9SPHI|nr:gliding motility-associated C-terminal domain-containing protein [Mucilaginibacter pedocola]OOQ59933.1 hypothetical protein BC343_27655 [Mucilaginibacter pedocola]